MPWGVIKVCCPKCPYFQKSFTRNKAYASGLITLPDGMMEAEAAADPDDADVEGMEDGEDEA